MAFRKSKFINTSPREHVNPHTIDIATAPVPAVANGISASLSRIACSTAGGRAISLFPLSCPYEAKTALHVSAHNQPINDIQFAPYQSNLLASCDGDGAVKLWQTPGTDPDSACSAWDKAEPALVIAGDGCAKEILQWHTTANHMLTAAGGDVISVYDVQGSAQKDVCTIKAGGTAENDGGDIHSLSWSYDGSLLACTDSKLGVCIYDIRVNSGNQRVMTMIPGGGKMGAQTKHKPSRVVWLGGLFDNKGLATVYLDKQRGSQLSVTDMRSGAKTLSTQSLNSSATSTPRVFYDADSDSIYLAAKNSVSVAVVSSRAPYYTPCTHLTVAPSLSAGGSVGGEGGACLIPKRAVNTMDCEVNRMLRCTNDRGGSIVPVSFEVPRKNKSEFHSDLFPMTRTKACVNAAEWAAGDSRLPRLANMKPQAEVELALPTPTTKDTTGQAKLSISPQSDAVPAQSDTPSEALPVPAQSDTPSEVLPVPAKKHIEVVRSSKLRHVLGKALHRNFNIEGVRDVNTNVSVDSHLCAANGVYVAYPTTGSGGSIAVVAREHSELPTPKPVTKVPDKGQRLTDKPMSVVNGAAMLDFTFSPTNPCKLAAACEDGVTRVWTLPEGTGAAAEDYSVDSIASAGGHARVVLLKGHNKKAHLVRFCPISHDVIATASYDDDICIWDATTGECHQTIRLGEGARPFSLTWSSDGNRIAAQCRDGKLRIFNSLSGECLKETEGHDSIRGGRLCYMNDDSLLVSTGFSKSSNRQMRVLDGDTLAVLSELSFDESPSILDISCDAGTGLVFLFAKGDNSVQLVEVTADGKSFALDSCMLAGVTLGLSYLQKHLCDVRNVEVARAVRLCNSHVETVSFSVPRTRTEVFQDDVFGEVVKDWEALLSAKDFFNAEAGTLTAQPKVSLCPKDMTKASEVPVVKTPPKQSRTFQQDSAPAAGLAPSDTDLMSRMAKLQLAAKDTKLEQDTMEGVDDDEWDD